MAEEDRIALLTATACLGDPDAPGKLDKTPMVDSARKEIGCEVMEHIDNFPKEDRIRIATNLFEEYGRKWSRQGRYTPRIMITHFTRLARALDRRDIVEKQLSLIGDDHLRPEEQSLRLELALCLLQMGAEPLAWYRDEAIAYLKIDNTDKTSFQILAFYPT